MNNTFYNETSQNADKWERTTGDGAPYMVGRGTNRLVQDSWAAFTAGAGAGTEVVIDVALPPALQMDSIYQLVVTNPSPESGIDIIVSNRETFGETVVYPELTRFSVPKGTADGVAVLVQGFLLGEAGRITVATDTAAVAAFNVDIRIRKV